MENKIKLYKCYKGTCSKCLNEEDPFITEEEYKNLLDADGKLQCPEGHLDCGIQELKPEDYPKPPKDNRKLLLFGGVILIVLLIVAGAVFMFTGKSKPVKPIAQTEGSIHKPVVDSLKIKNPIDVQKEKMQLLISEADKMFSNKEYEKAKLKYQDVLVYDPANDHSKSQLSAIQKEMNRVPPGEGSGGGKGGNGLEYSPRTLSLDYGKYEGPTKNGLANGQGIMYFNQRHVINPNDPEQRYAEAGEYVSGIFHNGYLTNGKLFGKDKQQKAALFIGQ